MATDIRQYPPKAPGNYGDYATAVDAPDDRFVLNLRGNQSVTVSPTRAVEPAKYTRLGVRLNINGGSLTPPEMTPAQRSMFFRDHNIQDINPAIPLTSFSKEECYRVARFLYDSKGGFGLFTGEAGESVSDWRLLADFAPQQLRWIAEGLQELKKQYAHIIPGPGNYSGVTVTNRGKTSFDAFKAAMTTGDSARSFMSQPDQQWGFINYYGLGLHTLGEIPLINAYLTQNDPAEMFYQTLMRMSLVAKGNEGVFDDIYQMILFVWVRCAAGLDPFTESFLMNYGNGLTAYTADFNIMHASLQLHQCAMALDFGNHLEGWENPYLFGTDKNTIASPYDAGRYNLQGSTQGRTLTDRYQSPPFQAGRQYPYPNIQYGHEDLLFQGAKMATNGRDYVDARLQPVAWRKAGTSSWLQPGADWLGRTIFDGLPHVTLSTKNGKNRVVMYDPAGSLTSGASTDIEVMTPQGAKTYECWLGVRNEFFD